MVQTFNYSGFAVYSIIECRLSYPLYYARQIMYPRFCKSDVDFCLALYSNVAAAQHPYIPFKHFSTTHGLSQNHVISILQDRQGFMWFGTLEGLNRFDGYEFTVSSTITKTQILALGGKIELESKVDKGTVFKVYFKRQTD